MSSSTQTFAQLQCTQKGGPFKIAQVAIPSVAEDQVLIRHKVIALNLIDYKQRDLGIQIATWPHVLGVEGAGIVDKVGSKVTHVKPGDEVAAWEIGQLRGLNWGGAYQELVVVPAQFVAKKPRNTSLQEAASLPICYNMAVIGIHQALGIPLPFIPGTDTTGNVPSSILILGGGSATGGAAIQLLRFAHPSIKILATASPRHFKRLSSLGATKVFDYSSSSVVDDILAEGGVEVIMDCVSAGATQTDISKVLKDNGPKKYAASFTGLNVPVPEGVTQILFGGATLTELKGGESVIPTLTKLVEEGHYKPPVPVRVLANSLEELPNVLDELKTVSGEKLLVNI